MGTFIVTFAVLLLAFGGLAIGLLHGKPIKGSCGGLSTMTGDRCDVCGGQPEKCEEASGR
ncbi:MAG: (Na+)-NQR maturation NqrM [Gammaproteobacteria bacterium]|jgi:uncharacterized protein|nr:(Na+)-NQR maturation NqrM [Gammaproteobacteria bacterium]